MASPRTRAMRALSGRVVVLLVFGALVAASAAPSSARVVFQEASEVEQAPLLDEAPPLDEAPAEAPPPGEGEPEEVAPPTATPLPPLGDRARPLPPGQALDLGDGWRVEVLFVVPDATDQVLDWNIYNAPPLSGQQFVSAMLRATYIGTGPSRLDAASRLRLLGPSGAEYSTYEHHCGVIPTEISNFTVFGPTVLEGSVCWAVRSEDVGGLLLFNRAFLDPAAFPFADLGGVGTAGGIPTPTPLPTLPPTATPQATTGATAQRPVLTATPAAPTATLPPISGLPVGGSGRAAGVVAPFTLAGGDYTLAWTANVAGSASSCSLNVALRLAAGPGAPRTLLSQTVSAASGTVRGSVNVSKVAPGTYTLDVKTTNCAWSVDFT